MTLNMDLLLTIASDINAIKAALIESGDLTGDTLPEIDSWDMGTLEEAQVVTSTLMRGVIGEQPEVDEINAEYVDFSAVERRVLGRLLESMSDEPQQLKPKDS